jgi:uncharacterized protein YegL
MAQLTAVTTFDFDRVSFEKDSEVHLDLILNAPERREQKRIPLHLILAVDCSGSMSGNKLTQVKSTINKLVDHLTENDTLGVIKFSQQAWEVLKAIPMTGENKTLAKNKVGEIQEMGMTNLSAAIEMSIEKATIADTSKTARIILLTDGLPTAGKCGKDELLNLAGLTNKRVSISCFGYGDDFDAELMASLSRMGRGNNFYIKTDDECNNAFALELGGLLSLFGQNIQINIVPSGNMVFKEILSEYKCEQKNGFRLLSPGNIEIKIDDIFVGETKHCLLKLDIPKATEAVCARPTTVCSIEIKYMDTETQKEVTVIESAKIQYVKAGRVASEPNLEVKKQLMILEAVRLQKEAKAKADSGDYDGAKVILGEAINFVNLNAQFIPQHDGYVQAFRGMTNDFADAGTYRTKGIRSATSFCYAASTGRGSSMDSLGTTSLSGIQRGMLQSFSADTPEKVDPPVSNV